MLSAFLWFNVFIMNNIHRPVGFLALFLLLITTAYGQDKIVLSSDPPPMAIPYKLVRKVGTATVGYYDKRDETQARSGFARGADNYRISVEASFVSKGTKVSKPAAITLSFFTTWDDRRYVDNRDIEIRLNDKELFSEMATFDWGADGGSVIYAATR